MAAYQDIVKSAVVVDGAVGEAAGPSQVVEAVRAAQPERLCKKNAEWQGTSDSSLSRYATRLCKSLCIVLRSVLYQHSLFDWMIDGVAVFRRGVR